jgi:hypothetical protein
MAPFQHQKLAPSWSRILRARLYLLLNSVEKIFSGNLLDWTWVESWDALNNIVRDVVILRRVFSIRAG